MIKAFGLLCLAIVCSGIGNIFLGKGMRQVGSLDGYRLRVLLRFLRRSVTNLHVVLGVVISALYFFFWLVVLSWADVSWALPMNGIEYLFVAVAAMIFLREKIDRNRWTGIALICAGIFFMMRSW